MLVQYYSEQKWLDMDFGWMNRLLGIKYFVVYRPDLTQLRALGKIALTMLLVVSKCRTAHCPNVFDALRYLIFCIL